MEYLAPLIIPAVRRHTATVIFIHGLGDSGAGWMPIAHNWRRLSKFGEVKFIFPNAPTMPVTLNFGMEMPSWYDMTPFTNLQVVHDEVGILRSRDYFYSLIKAEKDSGIPSSRIVLGGFSQGGSMSLLSGATCQDKLAGIVGLSCYLPMGDKVKGLIPESNPNRDTPIFMGHGDKDMLVKYEWGQQSAKALEGFGFHVDFRTYHNLDHSADPQEMDDLEEFLKKQLPEEGNVGSAKA